MVFNSYTFIVFFIIMLVLHNLPFSWKTKKINLLLASYLFYAAWNPPFILLLWLSTLVDFFVGRALYTQENKYKKRLLLVLSLIGNLGMLCFFKYGGFLLENFVTLVNVMGINFHPAKPDIILPAGISFYTFTTLCYTIDMYKRKSKPVKSFLNFSLFVTFFPHLVAGPIVRPPQLVPQFETPRKATQQQLLQGLFLLSLGLFMKVVVADTLLASSANTVFGFSKPLPGLDAWMGVLAFSGQIFFDFAGYSTCAVGVALCLGFVLPQNFLYPYAAIGFSDFWRRWHITLSAWLRDYLYIPLGGSKGGKWSRVRNTLIIFLVSGFWHGANWTFIIWGLLNAIYIMPLILFQTNRSNLDIVAQGKYLPSPREVMSILVTFGLTVFAWIFFRSESLGAAIHYISKIFSRSFFTIPSIKLLLPIISPVKIFFVLLVFVIIEWMGRHEQYALANMEIKLPKVVRWATYYLILLTIFYFVGSSQQFIYFQF